MSYIIVGLGNRGEEYEQTRHNLGRILVEHFREKHFFPEWKRDKRGFLLSQKKIGPENISLVLPELLMNRSGAAIKPLVKSKKQAEQLIVVHDDIDLVFGGYKVSFGRGTGGHRGVESIARTLGTKNFIRLRVGIAPATPSGKIKKPKGEERVLTFLMDNMGKKEMKVLPKLSFQVDSVLEDIISLGRERAMNQHN